MIQNKAQKAFIAILVVCTWACTNNNSRPSVQQPDGVQAASGREVFKKYCVSCHGSNGQLGLNGAKNLATSTLTLEERIAVITHGRKLMAAYKGTLSEQEIAAVAAYTMEL